MRGRAFDGSLAVAGVDSAALRRHIGEIARPDRAARRAARSAPGDAGAPSRRARTAPPTGEHHPLLLAALVLALARSSPRRCCSRSCSSARRELKSAAGRARGSGRARSSPRSPSPSSPAPTSTRALCTPSTSSPSRVAAGMLWGAFVLVNASWVFAPLSGLGQARHDAIWPLLQSWLALVSLRAAALCSTCRSVAGWRRVRDARPAAARDTGVGAARRRPRRLLLAAHARRQPGALPRRAPGHRPGHRAQSVARHHQALLPRLPAAQRRRARRRRCSSGRCSCRARCRAWSATAAASRGRASSSASRRATRRSASCPTRASCPSAPSTPRSCRSASSSPVARRRAARHSAAEAAAPRAARWHRRARARGAPKLIGESATLLGWVMPQAGRRRRAAHRQHRRRLRRGQALLTEHYAAFERNLDDDEIDDTDPTQKDFLFGALLREMGAARQPRRAPGLRSRARASSLEGQARRRFYERFLVRPGGARRRRLRRAQPGPAPAHPISVVSARRHRGAADRARQRAAADPDVEGAARAHGPRGHRQRRAAAPAPPRRAIAFCGCRTSSTPRSPAAATAACASSPRSRSRCSPAARSSSPVRDAIDYHPIYVERMRQGAASR